MNCKGECGNACERRLVPVHFTAVFCRPRKNYLGKLDPDKFFHAKITVSAEEVADGGELCPRNCTLYIALMDDSRSWWVKRLRRAWATIYELLG